MTLKRGSSPITVAANAAELAKAGHRPSAAQTIAERRAQTETPGDHYHSNDTGKGAAHLAKEGKARK